MSNPVSKDIYFHNLSRKLLENNFCERRWVTLYRKENTVSSLNNEVEIYSLMWTYLITPEYTPIALEKFESDIRLEDSEIIGIEGSNCEPVVIEMNFYDIRPIKHQLRINEKFIYLFNLYE